MSLSLANIQIGHAVNEEHNTGCTVFLMPPGTTGTAEVRGQAPGTREVALLDFDKKREKEVHALLFSGGSAFGLAAADGVMQFLADQGIGHPTPVRPVPIVPTAIIYDFILSHGRFTPDAPLGLAACHNAHHHNTAQGNVGVGRGATVGKWGGFPTKMKGGFGLASHQDGDLVIMAAVVVNAVGDVVAEDGTVLAGARNSDGSWTVTDNPHRLWLGPPPTPPDNTNTTLALLATNAQLTKAQTNQLVQRVHDGLAIAIRPVHTAHDGDIAFALATNVVTDFEFFHLANIAVNVVTEAIRNSVRHAHTIDDVPGLASQETDN